MAKKKVKKSSSKSETKPLEGRPDLNSNQLATQSLTMKICRLCEAKDGPFINIFDVEQSTHKKIEMLLPFSVTENDGLPHNVCFRCSAKVEDTFEFVQKCIRSQTNLCKMFGKEAQAISDTKDPKKLWENKLVQSNMSNEDVCDAVIKKAMEGIPGIPLSLQPGPLTDVKDDTVKPKRKTRNLNENVYKEEIISSQTFTHTKQNNSNEPKKKTRVNPLTEARLSELSKLNAELNSTIKEMNNLENEPNPSTEQKPSKSDTTFNKINFSFDFEDNVQQFKVKEQTMSLKKRKSIKPAKESVIEDKTTSSDVIRIPDDDNEQNTAKPQTKPAEPAAKNEKQAEITTPKDPNFNIMDHVSMIKVNGVGVLFQCGLCNRNFLKKDVLQNHGCAKTGVAKPDIKSLKPVIEPPKNPMASVKFLTNKPVEEKSDVVNVEKPKPKAGPASRVKKVTTENIIGMKITPTTPEPQLFQPQPHMSQPQPHMSQPQLSQPQLSHPQLTQPQIPQPQIPQPNQNTFTGSNLYKLIPGPNNSYTLVQDTETSKHNLIPIENTIHDSDSEPETVPISKPGPKSRVRKFTRPRSGETPPQPTQASQPYPVGLFAVNSNSEEIITPIQTPMTFGQQYQNPMQTPVYPQMQQQLYANQIQQQHYQNQMAMQQQYEHQMQPQILNNMMPQPNMQQNFMHNQYQAQPVAERAVTFTTPAMKKQSYTVVQTGHPSRLLISTRPRPDLPGKEMHGSSSNNIIQESQISTSAPIEYPYKCHMCPISFSRDKKLQAHLQWHYTKLEDPQSVPKKKIRRS